jgi:hypothetical protein
MASTNNRYSDVFSKESSDSFKNTKKNGTLSSKKKKTVRPGTKIFKYSNPLAFLAATVHLKTYASFFCSNPF